jgi:hypothetical protein
VNLINARKLYRSYKNKRNRESNITEKNRYKDNYRSDDLIKNNSVNKNKDNLEESLKIYSHSFLTHQETVENKIPVNARNSTVHSQNFNDIENCEEFVFSGDEK